MGTIKGVARKLGVHRRLVREALADAVPKERKKPERERPKLSEAIPFVDAILTADRKAPRKQRHTAHRIYDRLRVEMPSVSVAESTVPQMKLLQELKTAKDDCYNVCAILMRRAILRRAGGRWVSGQSLDGLRVI